MHFSFLSHTVLELRNDSYANAVSIVQVISLEAMTLAVIFGLLYSHCGLVSSILRRREGLSHSR